MVAQFPWKALRSSTIEAEDPVIGVDQTSFIHAGLVTFEAAAVGVTWITTVVNRNAPVTMQIVVRFGADVEAEVSMADVAEVGAVGDSMKTEGGAVTMAPRAMNSIIEVVTVFLKIDATTGTTIGNILRKLCPKDKQQTEAISCNCQQVE